MVEWLNGRRCPNGCLCKYVAISPLLYSPQNPHQFHYCGSCFRFSKLCQFLFVFIYYIHFPFANTFPRRAHKSKVKFFTRTQLSVKNFSIYMFTRCSGEKLGVTGNGDHLSELQEHLKIPFHVPMSISILKCSDLLGFFNVCSS